MPEGDTIFRTARTLDRVLTGKVVTRFESVYPAITRLAEDQPVVGRTIESVTARGKHSSWHSRAISSSIPTCV
jgi:endonuclease-8